MLSTRLRLAAAMSGLAVFGMLGNAHATTGPSAGPKTLTITDDVGDEKGAQAATDIKQVVVTTTGKTVSKKVKTKTIKTYTPDTLIVKLILSAPPTALPPVVYEVDSKISTCGGFFLYWDPQEIASGGFVSCGSPPDASGNDSTTLAVVPVVSDSTITWTMPLASFPKEIRLSSTITDFHSYIAIAEPNTGASPGIFTNAADFDDADSGDVFKIGG